MAGQECPRTIEELSALSVGPAFGTEDRLIDGVMRTCPVMEPVVAFFVDDTTPMSWTDAQGSWILGRYASGQWFKRRA